MGANLDNIHEIYNILCHKNEKNAYIIMLFSRFLLFIRHRKSF